MTDARTEARDADSPPDVVANDASVVDAGSASSIETSVTLAGRSFAAWTLLLSVFAICLGCIIFGRLQGIGVIPASVCEACNDIRLRAAAPEPS